MRDDSFPFVGNTAPFPRAAQAWGYLSAVLPGPGPAVRAGSGSTSKYVKNGHQYIEK